MRLSFVAAAAVVASTLVGCAASSTPTDDGDASNDALTAAASTSCSAAAYNTVEDQPPVLHMRRHNVLVADFVGFKRRIVDLIGAIVQDGGPHGLNDILKPECDLYTLGLFALHVKSPL